MILRDATAAYNAGLDALDNRGERQAVPPIEAALRLHPDDARLHQVAGLLFRNLAELAPAIAHFATAARLAPGSAQIALGHAHSLLEAGLPAIAAFDRAATLAQDRRSVWPGLAAALLQAEGVAAAAARIEAILRADPAWVDGYWLLARYRWMMGERGESVDPLRALIGQHPRELVLWRQLILILTHAKLYPEALETTRAAGRALGAHPALAHSEASCLAEIGDIAAADAAFAAIAPPAGPEEAVPLIRLHLRAGRPDAAAVLAEAQASKPNGALVIPYLATAWRMLGDPRWDWLEGDRRLIGVYDIGGKLGSLSVLADVLRRLHREGGQPLEQSVRGGTQTDGPMLSRLEPEIRELRAALVATITDHVRQLPPRDPTHPFLAHRGEGEVRFTGSWSVRLAGSGFHTQHVHPAGWLSSAFYAIVPQRGVDEPETAGWLALGEPPAELGIALPPIRLVEPKPGRLALFPSTMWHGTRPFAAGERMTVAFDVAPPTGR